MTITWLITTPISIHQNELKQRSIQGLLFNLTGKHPRDNMVYHIFSRHCSLYWTLRRNLRTKCAVLNVTKSIWQTTLFISVSEEPIPSTFRVDVICRNWCWRFFLIFGNDVKYNKILIDPHDEVIVGIRNVCWSLDKTSMDSYAMKASSYTKSTFSVAGCHNWDTYVLLLKG
jgi:hypothetical protein